MSQSQRPGMGAIPFDGGTTFRVWAKFATSVHVAGSFNAWSETETPLYQEGGGYWSADTRAEIGDEYKYVIHNGETKLLKNDPCARELTHSAGVSIVSARHFDWQNDSFVTPPWNDLVIYEVHVGTFNDHEGGPVGQLSAVQQRLTYLRDLGINCLELMPLMEFEADHSWGYNVSYPYAIERAYGGPAALKELVREAHKMGIAVILDVVYNHLGPNNLDMWQFDGWTVDGGGGIYFYNDDRKFTPWGDTRPDYGRPEVRQYFHDNAMMWIDEFHVDGLRFDATVCVRREKGFCGGSCCGAEIPEGWSLLQWINDSVRSKYINKLTIAEDMQGEEALIRDTNTGGAGMGTQWAPEFVHTMRSVLSPPSDEARDTRKVTYAVTQRYTTDAFRRVIYTESHDDVANGRARLSQEIDHGDPGSYYARKRVTLGAAVLMTSPGIPMLFQGQEILEDEWFRDTDPIDWNKLNRFRGVHDAFRDLIKLRRNWLNNTRGLRGQNVNVYHENNEGKLVAYHRWEDGGVGDDVVVVLNFSYRAFSAYRLGLPHPGTWFVRFNSDAGLYDPEFGAVHCYDTVAETWPLDGMPYSGDVAIGPYSAVIFSQ